MYQPIILYSHATGPNPWKVAIILEELGLKYESKYVEMADMKKRPFEGINPNGRVPTIEDPNSGIGRNHRYDTSANLTYKHLESGALLSQAMAPLPDVRPRPILGSGCLVHTFPLRKDPVGLRERYVKEMKRVIGVLNRALQSKLYLVGDKCTYADLAFLPWTWMQPFILQDETIDAEKEYPNYHAWMSA